MDASGEGAVRRPETALESSILTDTPMAPPGVRARTLRVGIAHPRDPREAGAWSGVPGGVARGLAQLGFEVEHVSSAQPRLVHSAVARLPRRVDHGRVIGSVNTLMARRRLAAAPPLDGVIQLGTDFTITPQVPLVTLDDMTVAQACSVPDPWLTAPPLARRAWVARQRHAYRIAAGCCVTSRWTAESVVAEYGIDPAKVHVVGFGCNRATAPAARDWTRPRFLFVGREFERKGGPALLRAFAAVREHSPDATLDVVGGHGRIDAPGVTGHGQLALESAEDQRRLDDLFARSTCFVMPSGYEPFGIAYVDAGAAGIPSIGTTVGGAADAIGDGGLLVDPSDEPQLVAAMQELADPATAQRLGEAARRHADLLTWPLVAERLVKALGLPLPDGRVPAEYL